MAETAGEKETEKSGKEKSRINKTEVIIMTAIAIGIILGCCALGAGMAMIAGIGPGIGEGNAVKLSAVSRRARVTLQRP